ncbi:MAG: hypothetical protein Q8R28_04320, partial [Dehalococcoidia bacterium]|nr:hypothetical protein [Dehalococcoidia bacterium]
SNAIAVKQAELSARAALPREEFISLLKASAFADRTQALEPESWAYRHPSAWPEPLRRLVTAILPTQYGIKVQFEASAKDKELLAKMLGFLTTTEDSSKFELHINLSQSQAQVQQTQPHDYGPLTVHLPTPQP